MAVPNQPCGLTNFDSRLVSKCPPNPNAIRSIIFSRDNLSVVNGASTEIQISLLPLFIPVSNAARTSISLPASIPNIPLTLYKLDLAGLDLNEEVKFLGLLPTYGASAAATSSLCSGATVTGSTTEFIEWAFIDDIEKGQLYDQTPLGPIGNTSFDISVINKFDFSWGGWVNATGASGSMWIATDGGLLKWDGAEMKLWNTLNSNSSTDYINTLSVDSYNNVWVGTDNGIARFFEKEGFSQKWNTLNSPILSNNVTSLKVLPSNKIAIGTDSGLSIFDKNANTWKNFNSYNTAQLHHNLIKSISSENSYIFTGTTGGVYVYDSSTNLWNSSPFNSNTPGWTAPNSVQCLESYGGNIYAGTTNGLVVVPYMGGTATTILSGATGPASNYYMSIRLVNKGGDYRLYIGHDNAYSVYSITSNSWISSSTSTSYPYLGSGVKDILPDYLSPAADETLFLGSLEPTEGLARIFAGGGSGASGASGPGFSYVPESDKLTNILLTIPLNPSCTPLAPPVTSPGQWKELLNNTTNVDASQLYANHQPLYFLFSKDMRGATGAVNFINRVTVSSGLEGSSDVVSGAWTANQTGKLFVFTPNAPLDKAAPYNLKVTQGATAGDGSNVKEKINVGFYTENISPVLGWNVLGKILIHSGADNKYTQGLYLRNPQVTGVNITTLIGR